MRTRVTNRNILRALLRLDFRSNLTRKHVSSNFVRPEQHRMSLDHRELDVLKYKYKYKIYL